MEVNAIPASGKLVAYILSYDDLKIKDIIEFEDYEFKQDIDYEDKTSITTFRQPNAETNDYVLCKCGKNTVFIGIFKEYESSSSSNEYKLTLLQKEKLFDRFIFVKNEGVISTVGIEDFIADSIRANWISSDDSKLDKKYINLNVRTHTKVYAKVASTVDLTDGCFNLKTYLGNVLEYYNVKLDFEITSTSLNINIYKDTAAAYQVNVNDSDISEYTETYSVDALAKLLVRYDQKESGSDDIVYSANYEYYLLTDRTISTDKSSADRAQGSVKSIVIEAESEEEMYQKVQDEFSSNSYSHKIAFNLYMDSAVYDYTSLYVGRSIKVRTKNGIRTTLVTATTVSNDSRFAEIELGKLKVTLIDKIRSTT